MDYALKQLLKESLSIYAFSSRNSDNEFTYAASATTVACRIQHRRVVIQTDEARQVMSTTQIYVDGATSIGANDKIVLPDGTIPKIMAIYKTPDETGAAYYKCIYT